jgi:hypothetical protein
MPSQTQRAPFEGAVPFVPLTNEPFHARMLRAIALMEAALPGMRGLAEQLAEAAIATNRLLVSGTHHVVQEWKGRSGGLMLLRPLGDDVAPEDALLHAAVGDAPVPDEARNAPCLKVLIGEEPVAGFAHVPSHAGACGLSESGAAALAGFVLTAEFVAACTRRGRMPVMYESIGMYHGFTRIHRFLHANQSFHGEGEGMYASEVGPQPAGVLGRAFLEGMRAIIERLEREMRPRIEHAAAWAIEAKRTGRRVAMMTMGKHLFPREVTESEMGQFFEAGDWPTGFSGRTMPELDFGPGDVILHIGYQHPPASLLRYAAAHGCKVAYSSVLEDRDYRDAPDVTWVDPMFRWEDAIVPLDGYPIPILPPSGLVNIVLTWELYRLARRAVDG